MALYLRQAGPADAPALVFLHGLWVSSAMWQPQIERLSSEYHCLAPDLPEHGKSTDIGSAGLHQYSRDTDQRHHYANNGRHRGYFPQQKYAQDDTTGHFLRGEQVGVGGVDAAHGGVVEGVSKSKREDAQRDDRADCSQRVGVREGEEECHGQEPQRSQAIDVGGVAKEWVAVALAASRYRIDGETDARYERDSVAEYHTMACGGQRAGGVVRLESGHDGDADDGYGDAQVFASGEWFAQEDGRKERDKDGRGIGQGERVRDGREAERTDVGEEVQGRHQAVKQEARHFLACQ